MHKFVAIIAALTAEAALAAPGGALNTLPLGEYHCELPGDATGALGIRTPEADFVIANASSYSTASGLGTYLLLGDKVVMTSGPLNGAEYRRLSSGLLRKVENGTDTRLRCVRGVRNNGH